MLVCCVSVSPSTTLQLPQPISELSTSDINFLFKKIDREKEMEERKNIKLSDFFLKYMYIDV